MALTISASVLFGAISLVLLRARYVTLGSALVLIFFGFFLAGTGVAAPINTACQALASALGGLTA